MNNIEIIDNFLDSSSFEELKNKLYSQQMFWTYSDILTKDNFIDILCNDLDNHIMTHLMYDQFLPLSDCFYWMKPIFDSTKMNIKALVRVRANLYLRTNEKIVHGYHTDFPFECKTAIFSINSNDGSFVNFKYTSPPGGTSLISETRSCPSEYSSVPPSVAVVTVSV